jgi:hypothetical protein
VTLPAKWISGEHIGDARPVQRVRLRRGVMDRHYAPFQKLGGGSMGKFGFIQDGKHGAAPWHAFWRNTGDWIDLPNVQSVEINQGFDGNGIATATIVIENVIAKAYAGLAGTYHAIKRGYLSPLLGFAVMQRTQLRADWSSEANEWLNVLNGGYRVLIEQGYGDDLEKSFTGLIDDTDIDVNPDTITITCRDYGQMFTDQRVFGWNKAREIRPPVIFCDRLKADKTKLVGSSARASSRHPGYPASAVLQKGTDRQWMSSGHSDGTTTEWCEVTLPAGRYTSFYMKLWASQARVYLSVKVKNGKVNGQDVPDGWIDVGKGSVGGVPYIRRWGKIVFGPTGSERDLGVEVVADSVTIRLSFQAYPLWERTGEYHVGLARLGGFRRKRKKEAKQKHWILVDDANDVVKWACMWAGFHEWEIEPAGARLAKTLVFHQSNFLIDLIERVKEQGQFVFHMRPPSEHEDSIGVPRFGYAKATEDAPAIAQVTDRDILTDVQPKWSKENLSYIIRVRGKAVSEGQPGGVPLGEDRTHRIQGVYLPPWSGAHHDVISGQYDHGPSFTDRLAGLRKHRVIYDEGVKTEKDAMKLAILAAIQECLASYTATIEVPGNPYLVLDENLSVIDKGSGVNSRLWVANVHSTFTDGTETRWTTTCSGALIDTPDMQVLRDDYAEIRKHAGVL